MSKTIVIRTGLDRLRYTLIFEIVLNVVISFSLSVFLQLQLIETFSLTIILGIKAMLVNLIYNYYYDKVDVYYERVPTERSYEHRIYHAVGFESILVITSLPIIMWMLSMTLLEALMLDITIMAFVVCYTFLFTLAYDRVFPVLQN